MARITFYSTVCLLVPFLRWVESGYL